jgi:hAT family C-terminal dimerisation region
MHSSESSIHETGIESKRKRIIRQILQRRGLSIGGEETIQSEVTRYLNTKATEDEERAPLMFWKNNRKNFPRLNRLAKNLLSISAGSSIVEELFSNVGLFRNGKRIQLSPTEINLMSVVHENYSAF